jgi:hypothetical protein
MLLPRPAQATDRAFRIGQARNVFVHRLITQGTFEERINHMIQEKKQLVRPSLDSPPCACARRCACTQACIIMVAPGL